MIDYTCPCCGFLGLGSPPYADVAGMGLIRGLPAPYATHLGMPSYEVCPCCGFEFGNDDDPGTATPETFEQYLENWIALGTPWFDLSKRPAKWSLSDQIRKAGEAQQRL